LFCPDEQIYFHDISHSKAELKLPSIPASPIIDPHLSPDGSMLAYLRDYELYVMNLLSNESKQLTHGAKENVVVSPVVG
jgi:dipeptidyl-peptidase-4